MSSYDPVNGRIASIGMLSLKIMKEQTKSLSQEVFTVVYIYSKDTENQDT